MDSLDEEIRKYALKNAIDYGKAKADNIIGKVIRNHKEIPVDEIKKRVFQ